MLVLPQKSLDQSNNLLDLGRAVSRVLLAEEAAGSGWVQNIYRSVSLLLLRPFMRKRVIELTQKVASATLLIENANWEGYTAKGYADLRRYRDKTAAIVRKLNDPAHKAEMKFLKADFEAYLHVSNRHLEVLDAFLNQLTPEVKASFGFTPVTEKDLWEGRSKGYTYSI